MKTIAVIDDDIYIGAMLEGQVSGVCFSCDCTCISSPIRLQ